MVKIVVKDEYSIRGVGVDSKIYDALCKRIKDFKDDEIVIDFCGLNVTTPWLNPMFCELMIDERVHIRVDANESFVRNVEVALKLIGCKNIHRVESVYRSEIKVDAAKEKRINDFKERFSKSFILDGNKLCVKIKLSELTQITNEDTLNILGECVKEYCVNNPSINKVEFDSTGVILGKSIIASMANLLNSQLFIDKGIEADIVDDINKDLVEKVYAHRLIKAGEVLPIDKKISILKQYEIKEGTVVMLSIFKKTRSVNEFGQMNDGVPVISRVAIFKGFKKEYGSEAILSFRSYKKGTFRTREDICLMNDFNDDIYEMEYQDFNFKISEIGFADKFTGKRAHFNLPIQFDDSGYLYLHSINNGSVSSNKYTLPEYAKYVFNSWGIEYNRDVLDFCISESDRILGKL